MDTVPAEFCESVIALWRCCDDPGEYCCRRRPLRPFEAAKLNIAEILYVAVYLNVVDGKWKYGFVNPDYDYYVDEVLDSNGQPQLHEVGPVEVILTMNELKKHSDLKRIRLGKLCINGMLNNSYLAQNYLKFLDVDMESLLKFISYLGDEPLLYTISLEGLNSAPGGVVLKRWLENRWFRTVRIVRFSANGEQALLDQRALGRKPTQFIVSYFKDREDGYVLIEYLKSGKPRNFVAENIVFPFEVMEAIIMNFRRNPEEYSKNSLAIVSTFATVEGTIEKRLEQMLNLGFCHIRHDKNVRIFIFEAGDQRISVCHDPSRDEYTISEYHTEDPVHDVWNCTMFIYLIYMLLGTGSIYFAILLQSWALVTV